MGKWFQNLRDAERRYSEIIRNNQADVDAKNLTVLRISLVSGAIIFAFLLIASFFSSLLSYLTVPYAIVLAGFFAMLLLLKGKRRLPIIPLIYGFYALVIVYSALTSAFISPHYVCVTILAFLFQFPVLYVDRSDRVCLATWLGTAFYLAVIWTYKSPALLTDEVINTVGFSVLATIIGVFTRRTQLDSIEMRRRLQEIAYTDQLTRIANRRQFFERLAESEQPGASDPITALIMMDLDDFKSFNDTYGHQAGDNCLRAVGKCFQEYEAQYGLIFYRYGGEEFASASTRYTAGELLRIFEQLRKSIMALRLAGGSATITISVGIAMRDTPEGSEYNKLLFMADQALYAAKASGKNRVVAYAPELTKIPGVINCPPSFRQR